MLLLLFSLSFFESPLCWNLVKINISAPENMHCLKRENVWWSLVWSSYVHKVMSESVFWTKKETGILILGQSCRTTWHLAIIVQKWFFTGIMLVNVIYTPISTPIWEKCILRTSSHEHQCPSLTGFSNKWFFFMLFIQIGHWDFIGVTMGESHIYMDKTLHTGKQKLKWNMRIIQFISV